MANLAAERGCIPGSRAPFTGTSRYDRPHAAGIAWMKNIGLCLELSAPKSYGLKAHALID